MIQHLKRLRELSLNDYLALIIFPCAYLVSIFFKKKNKDLILICESASEARDNGYWLFKYIRETDPEAHVAYVINFDSPDYHKVERLGPCVQFGSFKHWVYYLSAGVNATSQKEGKPNAAVFYLLEIILGWVKNKQVFLQHGITINEASWLYYRNSKFLGFICGAEPEYQEIKARYGYPEGAVQYLGFTRFDNLHNLRVNPKQILVMPTWREWLDVKTDAHYQFEEGESFEDSEYYQAWNNFLNHPVLHRFLGNNGLSLIFYPHRNIQKHLHKFDRGSKYITFASWEDFDIQTLMQESAFMVTDYSSVFMDFAYMRKPMAFYQFDQGKFREGQYGEGYFSYEKDGFGPVFTDDVLPLINYLYESYEENFVLNEQYQSRVNKFFPLYDQNNCLRTYNYIKTLLKRSV